MSFEHGPDVLASHTASIANITRGWLGFPPDAEIPIADAWVVGVIELRLSGPVPRLALFKTSLPRGADRRACEGRHITVIAAPRPWDGTYVAAVGSGSHFDPVL